MEIKMTLVPKNINGTEYYTDNKVFYTFHLIKAATETLWDLACMDLGIIDKTSFTSLETKNITDLAGIGPRYPTKFLLLKNGNAIPITYLANGSPNLHPNDIILRPTVDPVASPVPKPISTAVPPSVSTKNVADRLKEIEDLHNKQLLTDPEYQEKRAKIIAEL
jgi:hypothetical protein